MRAVIKNVPRLSLGMRNSNGSFGHSTRRQASSSSVQPLKVDPPEARNPHMQTLRPLRKLPLSQLIRTHLVMSISSSPRLLDCITWVINRMLASRTAVFDPDRNRLLRWVFQQTFYRQFCAGENKQQVQRTISELQDVGYDGVVLEYASEVLDEHTQASTGRTTAQDVESIKKWRTDVITTVEMAGSGDCVALKWVPMITMT